MAVVAGGSAKISVKSIESLLRVTGGWLWRAGLVSSAAGSRPLPEICRFMALMSVDAALDYSGAPMGAQAADHGVEVVAEVAGEAAQGRQCSGLGVLDPGRKALSVELGSWGFPQGWVVSTFGGQARWRIPDTEGRSSLVQEAVDQDSSPGLWRAALRDWWPPGVSSAPIPRALLPHRGAGRPELVRVPATPIRYDSLSSVTTSSPDRGKKAVLLAPTPRPATPCSSSWTSTESPASPSSCPSGRRFRPPHAGGEAERTRTDSPASDERIYLVT